MPDTIAPPCTSPAMLPKLIGADVELGNFIQGLTARDGTGRAASRALLAEIEGLPNSHGAAVSYSSGYAYGGDYSQAWYGNGYGDGYGDYGRAYGKVGAGSGGDPRDVGRKYLATNGGCVYIDLDHLEVCIPEVTNAWDYVAAFHAMLRVARLARMQANAKLPQGRSIEVFANNSDGQGSSWGGHLSFLLARRAWESLFYTRLDYLLWLASYQVSSIVFTGQGKVGAENGAPPVDFQLSQRADFFEQLVGPQTTWQRPVVNSRNESLCGSNRSDHARLHVIAYDTTLCHVSTLLKAGVHQIILAMIEAESKRIDPALMLQNPVDAFQRFSHDPGLTARAPTLVGEELSALDLQRRYCEAASDFVASGACEGIVPRAAEIVLLWGETLDLLAARNFDALCGSLDWVLKYKALQALLSAHPHLTFQSPEIKHLDLLFAGLDPEEGLFYAFDRDGMVRRLVSPRHIHRFCHEPPDDTRAYTRAMILRRTEARRIEAVDWDYVRFRGASYSAMGRRLEMGDPLALTRTQAEPIFRHRGALPLDGLLDALETQADSHENRPTRFVLSPAPLSHVEKTGERSILLQDVPKGHEDDHPTDERSKEDHGNP